MKKYGVLPVNKFAQVTHTYEVINQVLNNQNQLTGWLLLEGNYTPEKEAEIIALGGQVFDLSDDYNDWKAQLDVVEE